MHRAFVRPVSRCGIVCRNQTREPYNIIITIASATTNVAAHEIGHCLNLFHTHETKFGVEDPDNCSNTGDLLCDTPPDPNLRDMVNGSCLYIGGGSYNPDTKNIMSYSLPTCLKHFSVGQILRARDAIANSSILKPVINCNCSGIFIFGKTNITSTETTTYTIPCNSTTFTSSQNIKKISSTSNSITITALNSSINDYAYISATVGGKLYKKEIWIGKPKIDVVMYSESNYVYLELVGVNSDIHKQQIKSIEWITLSKVGTAYMGIAHNLFENLANGVGTSWGINAQIKVTIDCGATYLSKYITPANAIPCDQAYSFIKTGNYNYAVIQIIDPCSNSFIESNTALVQDEEIGNVLLADSFGNLVRSFNNNRINTEGIKKGVYILYTQIKGKSVNQKIVIE